MGLRWALLFILTVSLALPAPAQTDPAPATAATRQKEMGARKAFASGDWDRALDLFSDLYAETLHPVYLRNIGRCHQKKREPQKAIDAFQDYLAKNKHLGPGERREIDGYIAEMERLRDEQARAPRPEATPAPAPPPVNEPLPPVHNPPPRRPPPRGRSRCLRFTPRRRRPRRGRWSPRLRRRRTSPSTGSGGSGPPSGPWWRGPWWRSSRSATAARRRRSARRGWSVASESDPGRCRPAGVRLRRGGPAERRGGERQRRSPLAVGAPAGHHRRPGHPHLRRPCGRRADAGRFRRLHRRRSRRDRGRHRHRAH